MQIRMAQFYKVSLEQYTKDYKKCLGEQDNGFIEAIYDSIKLPKRATSGSAGYDFFTPFNISLAPGESIKIPTGIRCEIDEGWCLNGYPRSGLGTKFRVQLDNTVGIIDSDYFESDNEGHIMFKITNDTKENKTVIIDADDAFAQGIFVMHGITRDDDTTERRNGGFGSTTKIKIPGTSNKSCGCC